MHATNICWCPYTNRELRRDDCTPEHVIPLALGGCNQLTIPVHARTNSELGSAVDAALADEFLTLVQRRIHGARGHSRTAPHVRVRHATYGEEARPAQITLLADQGGLQIWDAKDRRILGEGEVAGASLTLNVQVRPFARLRFLAKVALSAGYFVYGNLFRTKVQHDDLRALMMATSSDEAASTLRASGLRLNHAFGPVKKADRETVGLEQALCQLAAGSCVLLSPGPSNLGVSVGVLGKWLGTLNIPASTGEFPVEDSHDLGHALLVDKGTLVRMSYRELCKRALAATEGMA